jgi:hypothetical protein
MSFSIGTHTGAGPPKSFRTWIRETSVHPCLRLVHHTFLSSSCSLTSKHALLPRYTNENLRVRPAAQPGDALLLLLSRAQEVFSFLQLISICSSGCTAHYDDDDSDRSIDDDSDISIADDDVQNLCVCVCVLGAPLSVAPSRLRHLTRCQPCPRNTLSVVTNVTLPPTRRDRPMAFAVTTTTRFTSGALLATNSCRTE